MLKKRGRARVYETVQSQKSKSKSKSGGGSMSRDREISDDPQTQLRNIKQTQKDIKCSLDNLRRFNELAENNEEKNRYLMRNKY